MMVLWAEREMNVKELGARLYLDSGTLTPLLKKLEQKGFLTRKRSNVDERNLIIHITESGLELREQAKNIPPQIAQCVQLSENEAQTLYTLLYKILNNMSSDND